MRVKFVVLPVVLATQMLGVSLSATARAQTHRRVVNHRVVKNSHPKRKKLIKKGGWAGAGLAAGHFAGPAGSAAVGAAKYRKDLAAGGKRSTKAAAKIGAPIAAGIVAGPAGTAGVEVVEHRNWIKRHIFHRTPHKTPPGRRAVHR